MNILTGGGVDLNRNYPFNWGVDVNPDSVGDTSHSPYDQTYCGPERLNGFSEPETSAIQRLVQDYTISHALSFHSGTELVIYPWGYTGDPCPDENLYITMCKEIQDETGYPYGTAPESIYLTSGTFEDHLYGIEGIITLCAEIYEGEEWWDIWKFFNPPENEISIYTTRCLPMLRILLKYSLLEPVGYWPFDEGSGTTAHDESGYGNDGTIHDAEWIDGRLEYALLFDGSTNYVDVPNSLSLQIPNEITIEAWVYRHSQSRDEAVVMKRSENTGFGLWFSKADNRAYFGTGSTEFGYVGSATTIEADRWYYVVGTYDNVVRRIYVNGVLENSENVAGQLAYNTVNLAIGKHNLADSYYFDGVIDEIRIYNRALSENEIWWHYSSAPPIIETLDAPSRVWTDNSFSVTVRVTNDLSILLENIDIYLDILDKDRQSIRENGPVKVTLKPNESQTLDMSITAPSSPCNYILRARAARYAGKNCDSTKAIEVVRGDWTKRTLPEPVYLGSPLTVRGKSVYALLIGIDPIPKIPYTLHIEYYAYGAGPVNTNDCPIYVDGNLIGYWEAETVINDDKNHVIELVNSFQATDGRTSYIIGFLNPVVENENIVYVSGRRGVRYCTNQPEPRTENRYVLKWPLGTGPSGHFYRWQSGRWENLVSPPATPGPGADIVYSGGNRIFGLRDDGLFDFWMYNIAADNWFLKAPAPCTAWTGSSLTWDEGNYIYAIRGGSSRNFMRYSISENSWVQLASTPISIDHRASIAYANGHVYLLRGRAFYRYSIADARWESLTAPDKLPDTVSKITWNGAQFILAIFEDSNKLWRYSTGTNTWTLEAKTPKYVQRGGNIAAKRDGWAGVFVTRGGGENDFWEYTPYTTTSTTLISPENGAVLTTRTPTFEWMEVKHPAETYYDLEILYGDLPVMVVKDLMTTSYTFKRPLLNGYYTWRVRTRTGWGDVGAVYSEKRTFAITSPTPAANTFLWTQTDWSGASGKLMWDNARDYYADEDIDVSDADNIKLAYRQYKFGNRAASISSYPIGRMETPLDFTSIRFTARHSKVLDKIRVYTSPVSGTPPPYTFGIQADDGTGKPSGTYLSSANYQPAKKWAEGWHVIDIPNIGLEADSIYHIVIHSADNYISDWENHIAIRRSTPHHRLIPSAQAEELEALDREANTLWSILAEDGWTIKNHQPIYVLDFADGTYDGNPYAIAGYHLPIDGQNYAGQVFKVPVDMRITKAGFFIQKVEYVVSGPSLYFALVDVDNGAVLENDVFATFSEVPESYGWVEKTLPEPIWLTGGHTYRFYLWTPTGTNLYRFNAPHTDLSTSPYSELTFGGAESAAIYSADNGKTWVVDNARDVVFRFEVIESMYRYSSGFLTSSVYDAEDVFNWSTIEWDNITPENAQVVVQVRADNRYPILTNWVTVENGQNLGVSARYFQYRVQLMGDGVATPIFREIRIHYGAAPPTDWTQENWSGGSTVPTLESGTWYSIYHKYYRDENIAATDNVGLKEISVENMANHVVISEVDVVAASGYEFVELYNPTGNAVDISGWTIDTETYEDDATIPSGATIAAYGFYSVGDTGSGADSEQTITITNTNAGVRIQNAGGTTIDMVGWGTGGAKGYYEGTPFANISSGTLERKALASSTASSMADGDSANGNGYDTDNNINDFVARATPQLQTSSSPKEKPPFGYALSGWLESSVYDAEQVVRWGTITWDASLSTVTVGENNAVDAEPDPLVDNSARVGSAANPLSNAQTLDGVYENITEANVGGGGENQNVLTNSSFEVGNPPENWAGITLEGTSTPNLGTVWEQFADAAPPAGTYVARAYARGNQSGWMSYAGQQGVSGVDSGTQVWIKYWVKRDYVYNSANMPDKGAAVEVEFASGGTTYKLRYFHAESGSPPADTSTIKYVTGSALTTSWAQYTQNVNSDINTKFGITSFTINAVRVASMARVQTAGTDSRYRVSWDNVTLLKETLGPADYRLRWEHRVTGINTSYENYRVLIYGYADLNENVGIYVWNAATAAWELVANLPTSPSWITYNITSAYFGGDNLSIKYDDSTDGDATPTSIYIDYCAAEGTSTYSTGITVYTRTGGTDNAYNGTWSEWAQATSGENVPSPDNRYIQYRVVLSSESPLVTPVLRQIRIEFDPNGLCISHAIGELNSLIETLDAMEIQHGVKNSLMVKLQNSLQKLESALEAVGSEQITGLLNAAIGQLDGFINEVEAQGGRHIEPGDANMLIERAQQVIEQVGNVLTVLP